MPVRHRKAFVGVTALQRRMTEARNFLKLPGIMISSWLTRMAHIRLPEDGHGHIANPKWRTSQPDRLHHGEKALLVKGEHHKTRSFP